MELIKCPICGEEYSPSYKSCPFCEEDDGAAGRRVPKRRVITRQKAQSARGGMIAVLALVLALFGWYLFGNQAAETVPDEPSVETAAETARPAARDAVPADSTEPPVQADSGEASDSTVHVDAAALAVKTNVSGTLPKDPMTGYYDCSLKKTDNIRLIITGTDVAVSDWRSENTGVVSVDGDGTLVPAGAGKTHVVATVGDATVTCIVRVR